MKRWRTILIGLAVGAIVVLGTGTWLLRRYATHAAMLYPVPGAAGVYRARNGFVDLYATKVGDGALLFDAGMDPRGEIARGLLRQIGAETSPLSVFVTHGHFDHIAAIPALERAHVWVGRDDVALMRGEGGRGQLVTRFISAVIGVAQARASDVIGARTEIAVPGTGERVVAIPAPGHTHGSTMYFFRGVLFAGDALDYRKDRLELPPARFSEDPAAARLSIERLPALLGNADLQVICTGHGGCTPPSTSRALLADLIGRASREREAL